jgi:hypothetical protein
LIGRVNDEPASLDVCGPCNGRAHGDTGRTKRNQE